MVVGAAALVALIVGALAGRSPVLGAIGAGALGAIWLPLAAWAGALAATTYDRVTIGSWLAFIARLGVWIVLWRFVTDPSMNAFDVIGTAVHQGAGQLGSWVRTAATWLVGALILIGALGILMGGQSKTPSSPAQNERVRAVRTGSSLGPVAAVILRSAARLGLTATAGMAWVALVAVAWTVSGVKGARVALGGVEPAGGPDFAVARAGGLLGRVNGGLRDRLARGSSSWGHRQTLGVWVGPASIERGANGELVAEEIWPQAQDEPDEVRELRELASGLLAAFDVSLVTGAARMRPSEREGAGDPRAAGPRPYPYRLEVARAWTRPGFHGIVVRATPSTANALIARVTAEQLLPTLDAETSWTAGELRGLKLSDRRVAQDPLRGGEPGVFVALDRLDEVEPVTLPGGPGRAAIERALREAGLGERFRYQSEDEGFDADTYEYRASFSTSGEWRELNTAWLGLQPAISLFARNSGAKLEARLEPYAFVCTLPKETPAFPSGEATDWTRVVTRMEPALRRRRLGFVLGLDHRGEPLIVELGAENPHLLIAGATGSGKSRSGLFSPLAQLIRLNDPSHLRLWLLDSVKKEVTSLFGDGEHVERSVIALDGTDVVAMVEAFAAAMDAQYGRLNGRDFDPDRDQSHLCVVDEFSDLRYSLGREEFDHVVRAVTRIGNLGRAAGFHLIIVVQRPTAEILPPAIKSAFRLRATGALSQASEYGSLFDIHKRLLPAVKGRLAIWDGVSVRQVQGLYASNEVIRQVVTSAGASKGPRAVASEPEAEDDDFPRRPTAREIAALDLITLARLIYGRQAESPDTIIVSVRSTVDLVRELGHTPGRIERYTAGLAELELRGILERAGEGSLAPRRLAGLSWREARARLLPAAVEADDAAA